MRSLLCISSSLYAHVAHQPTVSASYRNSCSASAPTSPSPSSSTTSRTKGTSYHWQPLGHLTGSGPLVDKTMEVVSNLRECVPVRGSGTSNCRAQFTGGNNYAPREEIMELLRPPRYAYVSGAQRVRLNRVNPNALVLTLVVRGLSGQNGVLSVCLDSTIWLITKTTKRCTACPSAFRHSDWWRLHRRTFHQRFQPRVMQEYYDIQRVATNTLIERLNASPDDFIEHINKFSSSMVLKIIYGYTLKEKDDPYYRLVYDAMEGILAGSNHGTFWVDYLPILKYVPSWLPGAGYKKKAQGWNKFILKLKEEPWSWVRRAVEKGTAEPSFCTQSAERLSITPGDNSVMENVVKNCATMSFVAGTDTSASALASFILAMVLNPELQVRAQKEIDGVVGSGRLPDFEDRDNLPFVNALLAETLRWGTVTPLAIAHRATDDDVYEGHFIPAGTTVIANSWAVLHDEKLYGRNPLDFDPYRFMNNDGKAPPSPELFAFGFGRRICPGRYFAINTIYLAISRLLASFTIARAIDDEGNEIIPDPGFTDGSVSHPRPFKCRFIPRNPHTKTQEPA
ncbi:hypothetical protein PM082_022641 [Marasmius tenuissimus]|nr:hypothetical protein PM082_022641 [Marasmius tenuissimus]